MPRAAPSSSDGSAPSSTVCRAGTTVYSAAVPNGRCQAASQIQTRSPTSTGSTPWPTASTVPAPSWLGICPSGPGCAFVRDFQSVGLTPEKATRTRTSPGPGSGSGRSISWRTSGPPGSR
jgi:hypothetical protein